MCKRTINYRFYLMLILAALAVIAAAFLRPLPAHAQTGSAAGLIAAVNAYRAENGLAPYTVDGGLEGKAQSQSDYQASIHTCTHQRADGSSAADQGISAENVACGTNLSVSGAIYYQWTDSVHIATILGPDSGLVGAGMAMSGSDVYYTLDVVLLSGGFNYRPPKQAGEQATPLPGQPSATPNSQPPLADAIITSTPHDDGLIRHVIKFGETLVQIADAYGITMTQLYSLNPGLNAKNAVYYAGQVLTIRLASTPTPDPSPTETPVPPTRTPRPPTQTPRPIRTATPVLSPTPTWTITPTPLFGLPPARELAHNPRAIGYGLIIFCSLGLLVVGFTGFRKGKR